jgi:uncharacterized cupin superfamily protein
MNEAPLADTSSGSTPPAAGWFVVNVRDAAWYTRAGFGSGCPFEAPEAQFDELGINVRVLRRGEANARYHRESAQEDFLVLAGECLLLIERQQRRLGPWDFVHCPPETEHVFVGASEDPCVILMTGARKDELAYTYPVVGLAQRHGAGVDRETTSPQEAYAGAATWEPKRPDGWSSLPWMEAT